MIFRGKRVRGIRIQHPLAEQTPRLLSEERLAQLVTSLRSGEASQSIKDEIVLGHVHLAIQIAGRYARATPRKSDVLVSEAIYGIVYAVNKIADRPADDNVTGWIVACCHRFAGHYLFKDFVVRPKWLGHRQRLQDTIPFVVELDPHYRPNQTGLATGQRRYSQDRNYSDVPAYKVRRHSEFELTDIRELLDQCAVTEVDRTIVGMRTEGYNDREIGERLGYSSKYVARLRNQIKERFEKMEGSR